jgi:hypothetical protein
MNDSHTEWISSRGPATPTPSRRISGPDNTKVSARLATIEERLDEIIRRLDELSTNLLTVLDHVQPLHQHTGEG